MIAKHKFFFFAVPLGEENRQKNSGLGESAVFFLTFKRKGDPSMMIHFDAISRRVAATLI